MRVFKLKTDIYLKTAVIISTPLFPLTFYLLIEKKPVNIAFFLISSCLYAGSCFYSLFPGNLLKTIRFRLFLDNILLFYLIVSISIFTTYENPKLLGFIFYSFFNQCLLSFIINNFLFDSNRKISYYFYVVLFLFPIVNFLIVEISLILVFLLYLTVILVCLIELFISKLLNELRQKNEEVIKLETEKLNEKTKNIALKEEKILKDREIITLKEEEIRKNEKIIDLTERLKRHEANNLLMRITTRLELISMELIKAGRKFESSKLEGDIKRLSQMLENEIEVKLFTVLREIKNLMTKRFDNVEIILVNESEHKNTRIKPVLVQIIFILVENSYEAGAKTVKISTENESLVISDDGPGFDIEKIQYGFSTKNKNSSSIIGGYGLQTAIDYLELNNVGFDIESKLNIGTRIKLSNFRKLGVI